MSTTITLEEAHVRLPEVIAELLPGEEIVITKDDQPVAKLVGEGATVRRPRQPGSARGKLLIVAEDEDHLKDFEGYMS